MVGDGAAVVVVAVAVEEQGLECCELIARRHPMDNQPD